MLTVLWSTPEQDWRWILRWRVSNTEEMMRPQSGNQSTNQRLHNQPIIRAEYSMFLFQCGGISWWFVRDWDGQYSSLGDGGEHHDRSSCRHHHHPHPLEVWFLREEESHWHRSQCQDQQTISSAHEWKWIHLMSLNLKKLKVKTSDFNNNSETK